MEINKNFRFIIFMPIGGQVGDLSLFFLIKYTFLKTQTLTYKSLIVSRFSPKTEA